MGHVLCHEYARTATFGSPLAISEMARPHAATGGHAYWHLLRLPG